MVAGGPVSRPAPTEFVQYEEPPPVWKHADWQKLWLATQRVEWSSLAIVPAGEMPAGFTVDIAVALAQTGSMHLGMPIRLGDATDVPLAQLKQFIDELARVANEGERIILALGPIAASATAKSLAQAADKSLLCVPLEMTKSKDAKRTLAEVGAKRFLGSAVFHV
jgi:hypothetical protein